MADRRDGTDAELGSRQCAACKSAHQGRDRHEARERIASGPWEKCACLEPRASTGCWAREEIDDAIDIMGLAWLQNSRPHVDLALWCQETMQLRSSTPRNSKIVNSRTRMEAGKRRHTHQHGDQAPHVFGQATFAKYLCASTALDAVSQEFSRILQPRQTIETVTFLDMPKIEHEHARAHDPSSWL